MNKFRWALLIPFAGLLVACSSMNHSAPIVDRTTGVKPAALFAGKPGYYVVKRGDTLSMISRLTRQKPADIAAWNNLANPNDIKVDQVLRLTPPGTPDAVVEAKAVGSPQRTMEEKPVAVAASAAANKTSPRGDKQVYSDSTLAAMQKNELPVSAAVPALTKQGDKAVPTTLSEEDAISWQWPAEGKIIATFSEGKSRGIDIGGKVGQKVNAAASGKVIYAGAFRGYGNLVIVKHTENLLSAYAHNKAILVKQGDSVSKGQQIAEMGNSDSEAVKLHFEIRRQGGKPVDPSKFLPAR